MCASTEREKKKKEGENITKFYQLSFNTCGKQVGHTAGRFIWPTLAMVVVFHDIIAFIFSRFCFHKIKIILKVSSIVIRNPRHLFFPPFPTLLLFLFFFADSFY